MYNYVFRKIEFDDNIETVLDKDTGLINCTYKVSCCIVFIRIQQGNRYTIYVSLLYGN